MAAGSIVVDLLMKTGSFETDTARAARSLKQLAREARELETAFKASFAGNLLANFAAQLGTALARMPGDVLRSIDALNDLSDATGDSVENLSALEDIALRTGTGVDVASDALIKLNKALEDARKNGDSAAGQAIKNLGLDIDALFKLSPVERLQAVGKALNGFGGENKLAYNMALLGKTVRETAPLLKDLGEAGALVGTVSTQTAQEVEKFNKELFALSKAATDVARSFAGPIVTELNKVTEVFREGSRQGRGFFETLWYGRRLLSGGDQALPKLDAGIGGNAFNPPLATLAPITAGSGAASKKAASDSKRAASDRLREAEFAAQQLLDLEEITARESAEAQSYYDKIRERQTKEHVEAEKMQWKQIFDFIDQEQEDAIEAGKEFLDKRVDALDDFAKNAAENIQRSLGDTLVDAMNGNFKNIGDGFKHMLDRMVAEALAANITRKLFGADSSGALTGTGGLAGEWLKSLGTLLGFAGGGSPPVGRPSIVGERGPELFVPNTAGVIIPAAQTAAVLAGGGGSIVQHFSITGPVDRRTEQQIAAAALRGLQRAGARAT